MRKSYVLPLVLTATLACTEKKAAEPTPAPVTPVAVQPAHLAPFAVLPAVLAPAGGAPSDDLVALGRQLYFETRLSKAGDLSCNSCHDLERHGVDGQPVSDGHLKQQGTRNSPTVFNAAGHATQFCDGRARDVEEQAKGPILNPVEMAMPDDKSVEKVLAGIPEYVAAFSRAFPGDPAPIRYDNVGKAIGAFERKLVTPARFDRFLAGDAAALSEAEKKGLVTFVETGCTMCHAGAFVGGAMLQKLGLVKPWPNQTDPGRFVVTKQEPDRMMFKVAGLRNVAKTGPYFHDGKVESLDEAVRLMARHQLGKELSAESTASIVAFLGALTGEPDRALIARPARLAMPRR